MESLQTNDDSELINQVCDVAEDGIPRQVRLTFKYIDNDKKETERQVRVVIIPEPIEGF